MMMLGGRSSASARVPRRIMKNNKNVLLTLYGTGISGSWRVVRELEDGIIERLLPGGQLLLQLVARFAGGGVVVEVLLFAGIFFQVVHLIEPVGEVMADEFQM